MSFTEAQLQFASIIALLTETNQLPASYGKVIDALTTKLKQLSEQERAITARAERIGAQS